MAGKSRHVEENQSEEQPRDFQSTKLYKKGNKTLRICQKIAAENSKPYIYGSTKENINALNNYRLHNMDEGKRKVKTEKETRLLKTN